MLWSHVSICKGGKFALVSLLLRLCLNAQWSIFSKNETFSLKCLIMSKIALCCFFTNFKLYKVVYYCIFYFHDLFSLFFIACSIKPAFLKWLWTIGAQIGTKILTVRIILHIKISILWIESMEVNGGTNEIFSVKVEWQ